MNKSELKSGDFIRFHDWGTGSFLFGIIVKDANDTLYKSDINIWRPRDKYFLLSHGIDNIELIKNESDIKDYEEDEFKDLIREAQYNNVYYRLT